MQKKIGQDLLQKANEYGADRFKDQWRIIIWSGTYDYLNDVIAHINFHFLNYYNMMPPSFINVDYAKLVNVKKIAKDYAPTNSNLGEALQRAHEVQIHGQYYAIRLTKKTASIPNRLGINLDLEDWEPTKD